MVPDNPHFVVNACCSDDQVCNASGERKGQWDKFRVPDLALVWPSSLLLRRPRIQSVGPNADAGGCVPQHQLAEPHKSRFCVTVRGKIIHGFHDGCWDFGFSATLRSRSHSAAQAEETRGEVRGARAGSVLLSKDPSTLPVLRNTPLLMFVVLMSQWSNHSEQHNMSSFSSLPVRLSLLLRMPPFK